MSHKQTWHQSKQTIPNDTVPSPCTSSDSSSAVVRTVLRRTRTLFSRKPILPKPVSLSAQLSASSKYTNVSLQILEEPEEHHRARYQTEHSGGAIKDREGNGFPIIQLANYNKPAILQVFIGTGIGRVSPHMYYQACKIYGKNATPCVERNIDGTCIIELQLDPEKEMTVTCNCVGIIKERYIDVEYRFRDQLCYRKRDKSMKCRMVFRTTITLDDGTLETIQVCSEPIVCGQPRATPEIFKKSLTFCSVNGGMELIALGKNFFKDTIVIFQECEGSHVRWEQKVIPDKEYLHLTHLVCVVPPYQRPDITEPVPVTLRVMSSGKTSQCHQFLYTPADWVPRDLVEPLPTSSHQSPSNFWQPNTFISDVEQNLYMMPPPESSMVSIPTIHPPINMPSTSASHLQPLCSLKEESTSESSHSSVIKQKRYRLLSESLPSINHPGLLMENDVSQIISTEPTIFQIQEAARMRNFGLLNVGEPSFPSSAKPLMSSRTPCEDMNVVVKTESANVLEQYLEEQTSVMASLRESTDAASLEESISATTSTEILDATSLEEEIHAPTSTEILDALVNFTAESHLNPKILDSSP